MGNADSSSASELSDVGPQPTDQPYSVPEESKQPDFAGGNSSDDSDLGLPPAIPMKAPAIGGFALPKLAIGGLGLSTVKQNGQDLT